VRKSSSLCSDDLSLVHAVNQSGEPEAREVIASLFNETVTPIERLANQPSSILAHERLTIHEAFKNLRTRLEVA
jgi:hypothetical protein